MPLYAHTIAGKLSEESIKDMQEKIRKEKREATLDISTKHELDDAFNYSITKRVNGTSIPLTKNDDFILQKYNLERIH